MSAKHKQNWFRLLWPVWEECSCVRSDHPVSRESTECNYKQFQQIHLLKNMWINSHYNRRLLQCTVKKCTKLQWLHLWVSRLLPTKCFNPYTPLSKFKLYIFLRKRTGFWRITINCRQRWTVEQLFRASWLKLRVHLMNFTQRWFLFETAPITLMHAPVFMFWSVWL